MNLSVATVPRASLSGSAWMSRYGAIVGLTSLAFTQPILDALARNDAYRAAGRFGWPELVTLLAVLGIVLPMVMVAADAMVGRLSRGTHGYGRNLILGGLSFTAMLALLRPALRIRALEEQHSLWMLTFTLALSVAVAVVWLWERWPAIRGWLAVFSLGTVLYPAMFAFQVWDPRSVHHLEQVVRPAGRPHPVVFVVFDELSGASLMNDRMEIDAERFPQFARLARDSTWYRRATSVHPRTGLALPAILTGRLPTATLYPQASNYPSNLFESIWNTGQYQMTVFEPVTRLCSDLDVATKHPTRYWDQCLELAATLTIYFPRLVLPPDSPFDLPAEPLIWRGVRPIPTDIEQLRTGQIVYSWSVNREQQQTHFLKCINQEETPHFWFQHLGLPHYPWSFQPSGTQYVMELAAPWPPPGGQGDIGEDWTNDAAEVRRCEYRYRLQLGYVDRFVGRLQDRLRKTGVWDDCLLIVMADHGVSFRAGHSRRLPDVENLPDLMSIPLFIKYPHQSEGRIDDRNAEIIDVMPTIAEVLELPLSAETDGVSLLGPDHKLRKTFLFERNTTIIEPDFPGLRNAVRHHWDVFGRLPLNEMPATALARPDWLGRSVSEFTTSEHKLDTVSFLTAFVSSESAPGATFVPCLVQGTIETADLPESQMMIVAALNGVVVDVCRFQEIEKGLFRFHLMLPEAMVTQQRSPKLDLYLVGRDGSRWQRFHSRTL